MMPTNIMFNLNTIKEDYDFSFARLILNEKEVPIKEIPATEYNSGCIHRYDNIDNKIIKLKNKKINLELIYSAESNCEQIYFIYDVNHNSLIIKENSTINRKSYFLEFKNFSITINYKKRKFYTLK